MSSCSDCSYLSSGGDFPDGYCIWLLRKGRAPICQGCYCKEGFKCQSPAADRIPDFEGQTVKVPCKII